MQLLGQIPEKQRDKASRYLEFKGYLKEAMTVNYKKSLTKNECVGFP